MASRLKVPVVEAIPHQFVDFMRDVVARIEDGDLSALTESNDLLQCPRAYGGLYDATEGRYGFDYFIDENENEDSDARDLYWGFDLDRQQIRDIAAGNITQLQLWRCEPDCGRRFPRSDDYCDVCDPAD